MLGNIHMEPLVVIFLSFAEIFFSGVHSATFTCRNNCPYKVWPATLTGDGHPQLPSTGFELASQATKSLDVPASWSGRFWARSLCSIDATGKFVCETADCASGQIECNGAAAIPPASLAEFTLGGYGGNDFYDISLVDGFNLPISVAPQGPDGCNSTSCPIDLNAKCPEELAVKGISGSVVACKNACLQFQQPQYCCTGDYGTPETCPPTSYSKFFKNLCPQGYSYAFDDKSSTFTCPTGVNYLVTICP